jgi:hypothetical protein
MLRFAADENFNNDILRGIVRRKPNLDIVRVQDFGLSGADDAAVLEWAAQEGRILLTHDVSTITAFAHQRVLLGKSMPGVVEVSQRIAARSAIADLVLLAECGEQGDLEGRVVYLPLH